MKKIFAPTFLLICLLLTSQSIAQVGIGTKNPNKSAVLDVSGNNRGFLPPRMSSSQRLNIASPAKGLIVFDNDSSYLFYFDGLAWKGIVNNRAGINKLTTVQILNLNSPSKGDLIYNLDSSQFYYYNGAKWVSLFNQGNNGPWKNKGTNVYLNNSSNSVGIGDSIPDKSATLDITATDKGILVPRMTSLQRNAIVSPAKGLMVFDNDSSYFFYFDGKVWRGLFTNNNSGPWYRSKNDVLLVNTTDSVGVGKTPKFDLDVRNTMNLDSFYKIAGITVLSTKGTENLFIGQDAGKNNTGSQNYFSGYHAGYVNKTFGGFFVGNNAGLNNISGQNNYFNGNDAGNNNTTGYDNHFCGNAAGFNNISGSGNFFDGEYAGFYNKTANLNHFCGNLAGSSNTTGYFNYFSGYSAGLSNSTGSSNVFIGNCAGAGNSTASRNQFIGDSAGSNNTTGSQNYFSSILTYKKICRTFIT